MHTIPEKTQDQLLKYLFVNNSCKFTLAIEARTINDPLCGNKSGKKISKYEYLYNTKHYRRFIIPIFLKNKVLRMRYKIKYFKIAKNLSNFSYKKNIIDKPEIIRLIIST